VAALRAAQVLLGPLNLVFAAFNAFTLPMFARRFADTRSLLRVGVAGSAVLGAVSTAWVAVLVLIPDSLGWAILGRNWEGADSVMLPSGLLLIAGALVLGASNGLMAMRRADLMLRVTIVQAPLFLLGVGGALWWDVVAAAYGFAVAQSVGLVATWWVFVGASTRPANSRHAARPSRLDRPRFRTGFRTGFR
jgi:O-antigen/teichoic acid export membrane protein